MTLLVDGVHLAVKDIRIELRTRHGLAGALSLGAITLILTGLAAGPDLARLRAVAPGLTWIAVLYAALVVGERLVRIDHEDDAFSALWLLVDDRRAIYAGKVMALALLLVTLQLVLWALAIAIFDLPVTPSLVWLIPIAVVSAFAIATVTCLVVSLVSVSPHRSLLLPVLLLPLLVPTLLAGVQSAAALLAGDPSASSSWAALLFLEASLFTGLGLLTYEAASAPD